MFAMAPAPRIPAKLTAHEKLTADFTSSFIPL
jgi:hypothetical protein